MKTFQTLLDENIVRAHKETVGESVARVTEAAKLKLQREGLAVEDPNLSANKGVRGKVRVGSTAGIRAEELIFDFRVVVPKALATWQVAQPWSQIEDPVLAAVAATFLARDFKVRISKFRWTGEQAPLPEETAMYLEIVLAREGRVEAFLSRNLQPRSLEAWFAKMLNPPTPPRCPNCGADLRKDGTCPVCAEPE